MQDMTPILEYLSESGIKYEVNSDSIRTFHTINGKDVSILGTLNNSFPESLPYFWLENASSYGLLAHVALQEQALDVADICYTKKDAVDIDVSQPGKLYYDALLLALRRVENSLSNSEENQEQIMDEYMSFWNCRVKEGRTITVLAEPQLESIYTLTTKLPHPGDRKHASNLSKRIFAYSDTSNIPFLNGFMQEFENHKTRKVQGKGILISTDNLIMLPEHDCSIKEWWAAQFHALSDQIKEQLKDYEGQKSKDCYIVLHSIHKGDPVWIAIEFKAQGGKQFLPVSEKNINNWDASAIKVAPISKEVLIPRTAGEKTLQDKKVAVIGCGSVGHQIAELLVKVGVRKVHLVDGDSFEPENIHKHALPISTLGDNKAAAFKHILEARYPFTDVTFKSSLMTGEDADKLKDYDVIVLATGSSAFERTIENNVRKLNPESIIVTTWNEPYGIGGHVLLNHPSDKGCIACTGVEPSSEEFEIGTNWLSFTKPGQDTLENIGGCGFDFIAFNAIDSSKTAILAADLIQQVMQGEVDESMAVSWRGSDRIFKEKNLKTTHRYQVSDKDILRTMNIYKKGCPNCCHD